MRKMKLSEAYNAIAPQVDELQRQMKNNHRDQLALTIELEKKQNLMKSLMTMVLREGDRDLTGDEVLTLSNPANV